MPATLTANDLPDWAKPSRILDSDLAPDSDWAQALLAGDELGAAQAYVRAVRDGGPLVAVEDTYIAVFERLYGRTFGQQGGHNYDPDLVIQKTYVGVYGITHTFEGDIDWMYDPTADWGDAMTREWQVQLNRHYQWVQLARAYRDSGEAKYASYWEFELRSWVGSQCPGPARKDMRLPGTWRTIDAGIRGGWTWPYAAELFRSSEAVSDGAYWLLVAALREHGRYLFYSPTGCNFKTMENISLAHAALVFPGIRDSEVYAKTALDRTIAELERQFYDDGLQVELAPSYGLLSAGCSLATLNLCARQGMAEPRDTRLQPRMWRRLAKCLSVYAEFAKPDGWIPHLHDDNMTNAAASYAMARELPYAADFLPETPIYQQTDCVSHLDWAGYAVLRRDGRWSMLDAGPWGAGHQHADALQVLAWADGGPWLIDPGKPLYDRTDFTRHVRSSAGHNVVLFDGRRHTPDPLRHQTDYPYPMAVLQVDGLSLAAASRVNQTLPSSDGADDRLTFRHERLLLDIGGLGWVVVDTLHGDTPPETAWEWLWHFPEGADLSVDGAAAQATRADGKSLHVRVAADTPLSLAVLRGQDAPEPLRGWAMDNTTRERIALPVLQATGGAGHQAIRCATLFAADPVDLSWTTADTLAIGGRQYTLVADAADPLLTSRLLTPQGEIDLPPHHLPADG